MTVNYSIKKLCNSGHGREPGTRRGQSGPVPPQAGNQQMPREARTDPARPRSGPGPAHTAPPAPRLLPHAHTAPPPASAPALPAMIHLVPGPGGHWPRRMRAEGPRVPVPRPPLSPSGAVGLTNTLFRLAFWAVNKRKSHTSENKSFHFFSHFCEVARQTGHCFCSRLISALAGCESSEPRGDLGKHAMVGAGRVGLCAND